MYASLKYYAFCTWHGPFPAAMNPRTRLALQLARSGGVDGRDVRQQHSAGRVHLLRRHERESFFLPTYARQISPSGTCLNTSCFCDPPPSSARAPEGAPKHTRACPRLSPSTPRSVQRISHTYISLAFHGVSHSAVDATFTPAGSVSFHSSLMLPPLHLPIFGFNVDPMDFRVANMLGSKWQQDVVC